MNTKTEQFAQKMLAAYYNSVIIKPVSIGVREVGYGTFDHKIAVRHLHFKNNNEFNDFLRIKTPPYVSASAAYYEAPGARPMNNKVWLGADLVFDIDLHHEQWDPDNKYNDFHELMNGVAFEKAKQMVIKLVEQFLVPDFGFSMKDISVNFSGNRGYHVRVYDNKIQKLSSRERREIVDYIAGRGLKFDSFFWFETNTRNPRVKALRGPTPDSRGWGGKIARRLLSLNYNSPEVPKGLKRKNKFEKFVQGVAKGNWDTKYISNKQDVWTQWAKQSAVIVGESTDTNVTIDTTRILRVPDTIHGTSFLSAKTFPYKLIEKFDPLVNAVVFTDKKNIEINIIKPVPEFTIKSKYYEPLKPKQVELPLCYALYLIGKGYAEISEIT